MQSRARGGQASECSLRVFAEVEVFSLQSREGQVWPRLGRKGLWGRCRCLGCPHTRWSVRLGKALGSGCLWQTPPRC